MINRTQGTHGFETTKKNEFKMPFGYKQIVSSNVFVKSTIVTETPNESIHVTSNKWNELIYNKI